MDSETIERLKEIKDQIKTLIYEAKDLIPHDTMAYKRFTSYPLPHILGALDKDNEYLGGSMINLEDIINDLERDIAPVGKCTHCGEELPLMEDKHGKMCCEDCDNLHNR